MEIHWIPFSSVPQISFKDAAYATANPALRPFYKYDVRPEVFAEVIRDKQQDAIDRNLLVQVLEEQYAPLETTDLVKNHIRELLDPRTFTVTTAHQPALFTGPLYYIYKIFSTINLAEQLRVWYPDFKFVPVFVNGAEDHDFEEINHTYIFGKKITWETEAGGPTGALATSSLLPLLDQLQELLGQSPQAQAIFEEIRAAYTSHATYGEATNDLLNRLFGEYGLVVLDMRHPALKRRFIPIMREELFMQSSQPLVEATQEALVKAGFSGQAYAREINLFYLQPGKRSRIVREGQQFKILDSPLVFSEQEIEEELSQYPERFSPNVVLRPLFQESMLPNLAYVGGGGEIAYWLERKPQFEHFKVNFPMLVRRNSVLWIDRGGSQKMEKLGIELQHMFLETDLLIRRFVEAQTEQALDLQEEIRGMEQLFEQVREKAVQVDPTLEKAVLAESAKQIKVLEQMESRLVRAEKQKHETAINQIKSLREKLFPGNGLQERHDNFLNLYQKYGDTLFQTLKNHLHPLEQGLLVIQDR